MAREGRIFDPLDYEEVKKFPACMRAALPEQLRGTLDWTLLPAMDEASAEAQGISTSSDSHVRKDAKL
jgi:hypothetical protein